MKQLSLVYIPCPSKDSAQKVAQHLLNARLVVCANLVNAESWYWDEGVVANSSEVIVIAKTMQSRVADLEKEVTRIHPYDTPCIVSMPINANEAYCSYVAQHVNAEKD